MKKDVYYDGSPIRAPIRKTVILDRSNRNWQGARMEPISLYIASKGADHNLVAFAQVTEPEFTTLQCKPLTSASRQGNSTP